MAWCRLALGATRKTINTENPWGRQRSTYAAVGTVAVGALAGDLEGGQQMNNKPYQTHIRFLGRFARRHVLMRDTRSTAQFWAVE